MMQEADSTCGSGTTVEAPMGGRSGYGAAPALIVVDLSNGCTDPRSPVGADVTPVVEVNRDLISVARRVGAPVIFLTVGFTPEEMQTSARFFMRKGPGMSGFLAGSKAIEIDARLGRRPDEPVVRKQFPSGFSGTDLQEMLVGQKVDTLVVTGISTSGCVRATVVDGLSNGYQVIVPREAVGDRDPQAHAQSMFDMDLKYCDVVSVADVTAYLESTATA